MLLAAPFAGLVPPARAGSSTVVVTMTDEMKFKPSPVVIHVGDTVRWESDSVLVHTVTADPSLAAKASDVALPDGAATFNSGNISPGGHFEHTFKTAGRYRYFCIPHEAVGMVGEVVVKP
ncbi:MAG TPA: plastocyanin/azurin family copper-binding protein [Gammaproteobacteria bacterium]|nr:plastocyanin/azurin family copper-binding protein [Gammaproteobacteria bacterium]